MSRLGWLFGLLAVPALLLAGAARADIYWGNDLSFGDEGTSYIGHARVNGSEANAQFLDVKLEKPVGLAADGSYIYAAFPGTKGGSIGRATLQGGSPEPDFIYGPGRTPLDGVDGIVATSKYVYWTNDLDRPEGVPPEIGRAPITGGEGEPGYITLPDNAMALTVSGNYLYWSEGTAIGRANTETGVAETGIVKNEHENGLGFVFALAANAEHLYWAHNVEDGGTTVGAIGRMSLSGGELEPELVTGLQPFEVGDDMTLDADHLYWDEEHSIGRAELDGSGADEDFIPDAGDPAGLTVDHRIVVDSTAEYKDAHPGDGVCAAEGHEALCTLRAAIEEVNAEKKTTRATIGVEIPGAELHKIALAAPLPKIEVPVYIDARSQPGALVAGARTIGLILDGSGLGSEPAQNGLVLGPGAEHSAVVGLQVQGFSGDGVLLEGAFQDVSDSVLTSDIDGVEIAGSDDFAGYNEGVPGDIFFQDGRQNVIGYVKGLAGKHQTTTLFEEGLSVFGAGVLMKKGSGGYVMGDDIGVHGAGFETAADKLPADGLKEFNATSGFAIGVLIAPTAASKGITGVRIGGTEADSDVISANLFGVVAIGEQSAPIDGLEILGSSFGAGVQGEVLEPFGGLFGVLAGGSIENLTIGDRLEGNSFRGMLIGAALAGQQLKAPAVYSNTFGVATAVGNTSSGIGFHDAFGLMLADVEGANIGGNELPEQGNSFPGALVGIGLAGEHLNNDTISHNTIGTAPATPFTTFEKLPTEYDTVLGIISADVFKGKSAGHALKLEDNTIQGTVLGLTTANVKGLQMFGNTLENNAFAMIDSGSGGEEIGGKEAGQGNSFLNDGFGLLESNVEPGASELQDAQVNAEDAKPSTRESALKVPDDELAFDSIDDITTADLSASSANTSAEPGSENEILGNRFGVGSAGGAQPDELPVMIAGNENGLRFGGSSPGEGNIVEDNRSGGLLIGGRGDQHPTVQILGNTIYNNENFTSTLPIPGLGINLVDEEGIGAGALGVDPQDPTQPDGGANHSQNSPVLSGAAAESGSLTVTGSLHGVASTVYLVEVFADEAANPFGAGEGEQRLGALELSTDGAGNVSFSATFADPGPAYRFVSSTATTVPGAGAVGVTSEFSVDAAIQRAAEPTPTVPSTPTTPTVPTPTTPTTPPKPAPPGAPTTTISTSGSGTATTESSSVTLPVKASCSSATSSPCAVTTTATAAGPTASATAVLAKAKKPITIGRGSMSLAHGATAAVKLTLDKQGLALLKKHGTLAITVTIKIAGSGRATLTRVLHLKLRYKKPAAKKR